MCSEVSLLLLATLSARHAKINKVSVKPFRRHDAHIQQREMATSAISIKSFARREEHMTFYVFVLAAEAPEAAVAVNRRTKEDDALQQFYNFIINY